jgi:hypothetical protein
MAAMAPDPRDPDLIHVPLQGTRAQTLQRLQVGLGGLLAMILLVGLANIIMDRARETEAAAVPEAAAASGQGGAAGVNDPLADAGVAPDVTVDPKPRPISTPDPDAIPDSPKR